MCRLGKIGGAMSRVGNNPIVVPGNVKININETKVLVEGPKGKLSKEIHPNIKLELKDGHIILTRKSEESMDKALHGNMRALVAGMVEGVTTGFTKTLVIEGVGYKAAIAGNKLSLVLGFTHPVEVVLPEGVTGKVEKNTTVILEGSNKEVLGTVAAKIRKIKRPDPYKAKGIKYLGEHIRRKLGKTATGSTGGGK